MIRLTIRDSRGQRTVALDRLELLVGGREGADVQLLDSRVAPHHCLLRLEGDRVRVLDLGSTAGVVRKGGRRIRDALLGRGEILQLGGALLRVDALGSAPDGALALEPDPVRPAPPWQSTPDGPPAAEPAVADASEFGRELRRMLAHAPWYAISLVCHLIALLVIHLLTAHTTSLTPTLQMSAAIDQTSPGPESPEAEAEIPALEELQPETAEPPAIDPDPAAGDPEADTEPRFDPELAREPRPLLGASGPLTGRLTRPLARPTLVRDPGVRVDRGDLEGEQRGARDAVQQGMGRGLGSLQGVSPDRILVVRGEFDSIERILVLYGIPHTVISRDQLRRERFPRARMLCINCDQLPSPMQRTTLVERVRAFVDNGGWLITSDWAVDPYLLSGWPRHVTQIVEKKRDQPDTTVGVRPQHASPLLEGVFHPHTRARAEWWLENSSLVVDVNPRLVDVLIVSDDLRRRYGGHAVAFTWWQQEGRVLHLLGHFYQKDGTRSGLVAMHRLTLNYLVERFERGR